MKSFRFLAATALTGAAFFSASAFAQAQPDQPETETELDSGQAFSGEEDAGLIVVTGSRIVRPELERAAPLIASLGEEELETRAYDNIADALNDVPGFGTPVSSAGDQSSFSVGQNFVNLFGIGSQRTLTLVNGRRFVTSNTASNFGGAAAGLQVDLNVIPLSLVERVDVLAVEGATTYGSDAIAGTVNVILKDDFEGVELRGQTGIFEEGDGFSALVSGTMGGNFDDDRGNIAFNFEYNKQDGILSSAREILREGLFRQSSDTLIPDRRIALLTRGGLPSRGPGIPAGIVSLGGGFTDSAGNIVQFDNEGQLVPFDAGEGFGLVDASGGDGLNLLDAGQIFGDLERFSAYSLGHYELSDDIRLFFESNYAHSEAQELANQPVYQSALFGGDSRGLGVLLSNPFLSDQARSVLLQPGNINRDLTGAEDADGNAIPDGVPDLAVDTDDDGVVDDRRFFLQRAGFDLLGGRNPNFNQLDLFRIVTGADGDFNVGDRLFNWQVSYSYGKSQAISTSTSLVQSNFLNAADAVGVSQDDVDDLTGSNRGINVIRNGQIVAATGGTLQVGDIACRVGISPPDPLGSDVGTPEQQRSVTDCIPLNLFGDAVASQEAVDFVTTVTTSESTNEQQIFNANVGGGLFELFENEIAFNVGYEYRREKQTFTPDGFLQEGLGRSVAISPVAGSFNTNEFFGELLIPIIQPSNDMFIDMLEINASTRYIDNSRAGTDWIYSVGGQLGIIPDVRFRGSYTESVRSPAITELFLPAVSVFSFAEDPCDEDYIDSGDNAATRAANCAAVGITQPFSSIIDDASQQITSSGNPNLLNEEAKSWTAGVIVQPRFIPGLTLTADWVNIELTNAIVTLSLTEIMRSCYDNANFPNVPTCNQFTRGPNGQITGANVGFSNAGTFEFAGLQASALYGFDVADVLGGARDYGRLDLAARYFYRDKLQQTVAGVLNDNLGEIGNFQHEASGTVRYMLGGTGVALTGTYLSSGVFDNEDPEDAPFRGVGDYFVMDASFSQMIDDRFTFRFTVNNLLEEEPPYPSRSTVNYTSGVLGREFIAGVTMNF